MKSDGSQQKFSSGGKMKAESASSSPKEIRSEMVEVQFLGWMGTAEPSRWCDLADSTAVTQYSV